MAGDLTNMEAGPSSPRGGPSPEVWAVARSNTFSCEWPELRDQLGKALVQAAKAFDSGSERPSSRAGSPVISVKGEAAGDEKIKAEENGSDEHGADGADADLTPSTQGGAVFPPFPPLSPSRRSREGSSASSPGAANGPAAPNSPGPSSPSGRPTIQLRTNGYNAPYAMFDDDWNEDIAIGGKMLPGRLEADKADQEVKRVVQMLAELDFPPFTLQRLAELLTAPRSQHKSLGKYLRAVEKTLLVTSSWEPPSYEPQPPVVYASSSTDPFSDASAIGAEGEDTGSVAAQWPVRRDGDSTLPISPRTPMFSPIPFLVQDRAETNGAAGEGGDGEGGGGAESGLAGAGSAMEEGLMSPLILGRSDVEPLENGRSPTPEPDDINMGEEENEQERPARTSPVRVQPTPSSTEISDASRLDPAHQPYLGRVDELDTGPVVANGAAAAAGTAGRAGSGSPGRPGAARGDEVADQARTAGTGEGGNMPLHGMSDRPVPISATTTVSEGTVDRQIRGMPRSRSGTISEATTAAAEDGGDTAGSPGRAADNEQSEDKKEEA